MKLADWPKHSDGREKQFSELSEAEKRAVPVVRRLIRDLFGIIADDVQFRVAFWRMRRRVVR